LQLLGKLLQEHGVSWKAVDDGHGLTTAALFLHPQLRGDLQRNRLIELLAALAVGFRPAALGTHRADACGVDEPPFAVIRHAGDDHDLRKCPSQKCRWKFCTKTTGWSQSTSRPALSCTPR